MDLPQKHLADRLLAQYFNCVHSVLPVHHWPIFISEYEKVHRSGSLSGKIPLNGRLFYLACSPAVLCTRWSQTAKRKVKITFARLVYLAFFLRILLARVRAKSHVPDLGRDEEMIAYVSGDMQRTSDSSWVWHRSETGSQLESMDYAGRTTPNGAGRTEIETDVEWEGWEWIEKTVQGLHNEHHRQTNCGQPEILMAELKQEVSSTPAPEAASNTDRRTSSALHACRLLALSKTDISLRAFFFPPQPR